VPDDLIERAIALYPKIKSTPGYKAVCVRSPWAFVCRLAIYEGLAVLEKRYRMKR
jgi:hypothetical protein